MGISGHPARTIFDRYNITSEDDLREAMQRTSDYVSAQTTRSNVTPIRPVVAKGVARRDQKVRRTVSESARFSRAVTVWRKWRARRDLNPRPLD
jgi:hypothetical protein